MTRTSTDDAADLDDDNDGSAATAMTVRLTGTNGGSVGLPNSAAPVHPAPSVLLWRGLYNGAGSMTS